MNSRQLAAILIGSVVLAAGGCGLYLLAAASGFPGVEGLALLGATAFLGGTGVAIVGVFLLLLIVVMKAFRGRSGGV